MSELADFYKRSYAGLGLFSVSPLIANLRKINEQEEDSILGKILWSFSLPVTLAVSLAVTAPIALACVAAMTLAAPVLFASEAWTEGFYEAVTNNTYADGEDGYTY